MKKILMALWILACNHQCFTAQSAHQEKYRQRLALAIKATPENSPQNLACKIKYLWMLHASYPSLMRHERVRKDIALHIGTLNRSLIEANIRTIKKAKEEARERSEMKQQEEKKDDDGWIVIDIRE